MKHIPYLIFITPLLVFWSLPGFTFFGGLLSWLIAGSLFLAIRWFCTQDEPPRPAPAKAPPKCCRTSIEGGQSCTRIAIYRSLYRGLPTDLCWCEEHAPAPRGQYTVQSIH